MPGHASLKRLVDSMVKIMISSIASSSEIQISRQRERWRTVLATVVGLAIAVFFALGILNDSMSNDSPVGMIMLATLVFLCGLLGFWVGFGAGHSRWIVPLLSTPVLAFAASFHAARERPEFFVFSFGIVGIVAIMTCLLRFWKGNLGYVVPGMDDADGLQFGIKHLFIGTTVVAVFVCECQLFIQGMGDWSDRYSLWLTILGMAICISLTTIVYIWAMFGNQVDHWKIITLTLVTALAMAANYYIAPGSGSSIVYAVLVSQCLMLFAMFSLRMQGLRFVKSGCSASTESQIGTE